jgi:hypothetical protein
MNIPRAVKAEIRKWVAAEIRSRIAEGQPEDASPEVLDAWRSYCREIADQISPERP